MWGINEIIFYMPMYAIIYGKWHTSGPIFNDCHIDPAEQIMNAILSSRILGVITTSTVSML